MPSPAKPEPMIAIPTSRAAAVPARAAAGWGWRVVVTGRAPVLGLLSTAQQATTFVEQCSIRTPRSPAMARRQRPPLAGRSVLITGAARGIGAALARKAAARGARVALVGLEPERLGALAGARGAGDPAREA